ncbi:outer envelope protein [Roseateles sp.]|uniref:outer envelope protein n=1 Tax=Roseateles sp. TaxID=1971397 RepID=UPI003264536D
MPRWPPAQPNPPTGATPLSACYGTKFGEPFGTNDIHKSIVDFNHVSGYSYGSNFFNVDLLLSDKKDPSSPNSGSGASEVYIVYRHTLDLSKVTDSKLAFGPVRNVGLTAGFDANVKVDAGYNSRKQMLVLGPTLMMDVPGFLNVSLLLLKESNAPYNKFSSTATPRYDYKTHLMLTAAWGIPLGKLPLAFEGFANYIASKGTDEFGGATGPEFNFDGQVMLDVGSATGGAPGKFKVGLEYQYWRNKFGNPYKGPAGSGAFAKTPMIRAEYHF